MESNLYIVRYIFGKRVEIPVTEDEILELSAKMCSNGLGKEFPPMPNEEVPNATR